MVLAARDEKKTAAAAAEIVAAAGNACFETLMLDLASQASVRRVAGEGIELQFGVCHLGHFLFTCLLAPALVKGAPSRVINYTSGGHRYSAVYLEDINFDHRPYDKWLAYGQAKTAAALFSLELDRRLSRDGVRSFSVQPGLVYGTDLARHLTRDDLKAQAGTLMQP